MLKEEYKSVMENRGWGYEKDTSLEDNDDR
jgi:hypothetical protein